MHSWAVKRAQWPGFKSRLNGKHSKHAGYAKNPSKFPEIGIQPPYPTPVM